MPQIITYGSALLRINTQKNSIEYSTNGGSTWIPRYTSSSSGTFRDLLLFGNEVIACTSKGIYYSTNGGSTWIPRYTSPSCGDFQSLATDGPRLLVTTTKGLYYSTNRGSTWIKKN